MKVFLFSLFVLLVTIPFGFAQKASIKIKGSDTCLPLIQKESEQFAKNHPNESVTVTGGGSGVGIAALIIGSADLAMTSRKLNLDEKVKLQSNGKSFKEKAFANDAVCIIVNQANKISQLTREQIQDIFTGKIKNWKELGWEDLTIIVYSRESSSGTYDFFKDRVLRGKNYAQGSLLIPATGAIVQSISQTKGAIGYVGFGYLTNRVKALKISYDGGKNYVEPTSENTLNQKYPIYRPLYFYYLTSNEALVAPFINFVLSSEGQKIEVLKGYIPLK